MKRISEDDIREAIVASGDGVYDFEAVCNKQLEADLKSLEDAREKIAQLTRDLLFRLGVKDYVDPMSDGFADQIINAIKGEK